MFKSRKKPTVKETLNGVNSIISQGTVVTGPISFIGTIKVSGVVNADLTGNYASTCENSVIVDADGVVTGNINCDNVIISGIVSGNIVARSVYFTSTAVIEGFVSYELIMIESGAQINSDLQRVLPPKPVDSNVPHLVEVSK